MDPIRICFFIGDYELEYCVFEKSNDLDVELHFSCGGQFGERKRPFVVFSEDPIGILHLFFMPPVENYANPKTCFFHVLFKAGALAFYILSTLFFNSFVIIFVVTVLLAALDFWVVKNVSGRILVGLRWWNEINDLGESVWKFESLDQESLARMNKKDSWLFWWTLYLAAAAWIVLGIFSLIRFEPDYCLIVGVCLTLSIANIVGFTKCRKDESDPAFKDLVEAVTLELSTNSIAANNVSSTLTVSIMLITRMPRSSSSSSQPRPLHLESHLPYSQHSVLYETCIAEGGHKAKMLALVQETLKIGVAVYKLGSIESADSLKFCRIQYICFVDL
ncbi:hypothetical protein POTOM_043672 [Populus tomentosa]|uniref:Golgi apparatus membrane protein TVP23 n=1 Tax=Populus tomentosa TaxID=118781 RepID=A0A8X7YEU4_POPTO|nr:hypothetical protein POTOM_043672 [Populus tomentosa]